MLRKGKIFIVLAVLLAAAFVAQAAISTPDMLNSVVIDGTDPDSPYAAWQSNRFTHMQDTKIDTVKYDLNGFKLVGENANLAFYIRESDTSIRILNKKNGYVWGALTDEESHEMNETWAAFADSLVSIEYLNTGANLQKIGAGDSTASRSFSYEDNKVICDVSFDMIGISLTAVAELKEDRIEFSVDESSIEENDSEYYLANLYFAPFLGATYSDKTPGYIFVPDGSGALMRFKATSDYLKGFSNRVYGYDYSIDNLLVVNNLNATRPNDFSKPEESVSLPVYGIVHGVNQNALFGKIESGMEYAAVTASPAGCENVAYNRAGVYFIYHQAYQQPTSKSGAGIQVVQSKKNNVNPKLSVYLLNGEDANYVGMANLYSDILTKEKKLPKEQADTPTLAVDFIMEDIQKGFFANTTKKISSVDYIENAMKQLTDEGIEDIHLTMLGWQKGGLSGYTKSKQYKSGCFGSFSNLDNLKKILSNGTVSLYTDYLRAHTPQISEYKDAAISLSQLPVSITRDDKSAFLGTTYYLKFPDMLTDLANQAKVLRSAKLGNPVIDGGNLLYGEYLTSSFASRVGVRKYAEKVFSSMAKKEKLTVFNPNDYLFAYADQYRNIPMNSSQYVFEDDTVPFLQIVLSGKMTMFAPYANDSFYSRSSVLKCIEYNCYPSFIMTEADNYDIKKTTVSDYSSTQFDDWKDTIVEIYNDINGVLSNVKGQQIKNHTVIADGVMAVEYESGMIYINYRSNDYDMQGKNLAALSAAYEAKGEVR